MKAGSAKAIRKKTSLALFAGCFLFAASGLVPALAVNKFLLQGVQDYRNGDFAAAAGNLGAAMPTEFNNPTLHYYMGNCCVHLKQMESAVREFRIAYALDPTGQVGRFAKQALDYLDVDAQGQGLTKKAPEQAAPRLDPAMERALATLDKQAGQGMQNTGRRQPGGTAPWWMGPKRGDVPPELARYLDGLSRQYESNQGGYYKRTPTEVQRSAENLKSLLQERHKDGKHHLSPVGTNLYTRNYTQSDTEKKTTTETQTPAPATPTPATGPAKDGRSN
jgi:tetratricopeptide (TPR) repeat protein